MADFTIARVSSQPPREWSFTDKKTGNPVPMETYKVMFEKEEEPVDVNRKPGNPPQVGETLAGTIEDTDFGRRFKADPKPFTKGPFGGFKDQGEIKAQWAIGQAVAIAIATNTTESLGILAIENRAKELFSMVERVKTVQPTPPQTGFEKAKATAAQLNKPGLDTVNFDVDEPINLDDIPF